jgi:hypothetical protein
MTFKVAKERIYRRLSLSCKNGTCNESGHHWSIVSLVTLRNSRIWR